MRTFEVLRQLVEVLLYSYKSVTVVRLISCKPCALILLLVSGSMFDAESQSVVMLFTMAWSSMDDGTST